MQIMQEQARVQAMSGATAQGSSTPITSGLPNPMNGAIAPGQVPINQISQRLIPSTEASSATGTPALPSTNTMGPSNRMVSTSGVNLTQDQLRQFVAMRNVNQVAQNAIAAQGK